MGRLMLRFRLGASVRPACRRELEADGDVEGGDGWAR